MRSIRNIEEFTLDDINSEIDQRNLQLDRFPFMQEEILALEARRSELMQKPEELTECHMDRVFILMETFEEYVHEEDGIKNDPELMPIADAVHEALFNLYQGIGRKVLHV